jgi:hypothetical protein
MKADDYDLSGAQHAMANFGLGNGDQTAWKEALAASEELFAALGKLNIYGFQVGKGRDSFGRAIENSVVFSLGNGGWVIAVKYSAGVDSCFEYAVANTPKRDRNAEMKWTPLPVVFDASVNGFTGKELDDRATREPGEPKPRRSAVTVIVEAVIAEFKDITTR